MLPGIGGLGAGNCTIFSQQRQDFFNRATSMTFICAAIMSRISLASSPTRRNSPPQSGQQVPGSSPLGSRAALSIPAAGGASSFGRQQTLLLQLMPSGVNLLPAYIVPMGNLRDRRTVEPNRHDNVELLRVTPTPPPFLTKNFDTHPIPRLRHVANDVVMTCHRLSRRYPAGVANRPVTFNISKHAENRNRARTGPTLRKFSSQKRGGVECQRRGRTRAYAAACQDLLPIIWQGMIVPEPPESATRVGFAVSRACKPDDIRTAQGDQTSRATGGLRQVASIALILGCTRRLASSRSMPIRSS